MNQLKVNQQQTIIALFEQGWSKRKIARELGLDRVTVRRYLLAAPQPGEGGAGAKSPTNPRTGSNPQISNSPTPQTGSEAAAAAKSPAHPRTGSGSAEGSGPESRCQPHRQRIEAALASGLSVQRIYQDLVAEHQFAGSYDSVWRFVLRLFFPS